MRETDSTPSSSVSAEGSRGAIGRDARNLPWENQKTGKNVAQVRRVTLTGSRPYSEILCSIEVEYVEYSTLSTVR